MYKVEYWLQRRIGPTCGPSHDESRSVWVSGEEMYRLYCNSCKNPKSRVAFGRELKQLGFRSKRKRDGLFYLLDRDFYR